MELCILIPAKNEEQTLHETIIDLQKKLKGKIPFNILIVNDYSDDGTVVLLERLTSKYPNLDYVSNNWDGGVGNAIRKGLTVWHGDIVAICMADGSDAPEDVLKSYFKIEQEGYDCVFGSRFINGGYVENYPFVKLILNRIFNNIVRIIHREQYNDYTNIFKVYHRRAIDIIQPIESNGFSIGLEMSLKAFKKKLNIAVIPISWTQKIDRVSKLKLRKNFKAYMSILIKFLRNESLK